MNKKTRIGLMVLVTILVLLAMTVPGLAEEEEPKCLVGILITDKGGEFIIKNYYVDLTAYWDDDTLINICTGNLPFGKLYLKDWWFATFKQTCDYWGDRVVCSQGVLYTDPTLWGSGYNIYDPNTGEFLEADYYWVTAHANGYLEFYMEYTPQKTPLTGLTDS